MPIETAYEIAEITGQLRSANGYFDCEKVITLNIAKQAANEASVKDIKDYLKTLLERLDELAVQKTANPADINYRYGAGFVKTLITTSYWYSWIKQSSLKP